MTTLDLAVDHWTQALRLCADLDIADAAELCTRLSHAVGAAATPLVGR